MNKLQFFTLFALVALILQMSAVSAISSFLYWPDGTTTFQTVSPTQDVDFNYTVTLPFFQSAVTEIKLIRNNDFQNPVATVAQIGGTGPHFGADVISASNLVGASQYTLYAQSRDTTTNAQDYALLDFQTIDTPPQWNLTNLSYVYDLAVTNNVNVVDLAQFAFDVDGQALTFSLDQSATNSNVISCSLVQGSVLNCNLNGVGITTLDVIVSDGNGNAIATITIEVIDSSMPNNAPQFNQSMNLFYSYNINLGQVTVVDLATVASDVDGDPLTFSLNTQNTDPNVVACALTGASVLDCTLNGIGTTTLNAIVSDGQLTDTVTITINVFNNTTPNNAPFFNNSLQLNYAYNINLGSVQVVDLSLFGVDLDNDPLTYSINTAATNTNIVGCTLVSGSIIDCNLNGLGTTSLTAIVSDGQIATPVTLTITVFNNTSNNAPFFNQSMALSYTYDLATTTQAQVVDLSLFGVDPDNDPLTYSINTQNTNPAIASCTLVFASIIDCAFSQVGTTSLTATVSDGSLSTTVTIFITVTNSTVPNSAPYYVNLQTVQVAPTGMQFIYDLQASSFDPDGDPTTNGFNLQSTNPAIINNCVLVGTGQLFCNVIGTGLTSINISVSDAQFTTYDQLLVNATPLPNTAPQFNSSLQTSYSYNINLGSVQVVDLAQFAFDADNDPLTFGLDLSQTDANVVSCSLTNGSIIGCNLNGVGTTTLDALVTDGKTVTSVTITITVFQQGPQAPVAIISSPGSAVVCESEISFDGTQSFSPDGTALVSYQWTVFDTAGTLVAQSASSAWTIPTCLEKGRYEVYLSVVDANGLVGQTQQSLLVRHPEPEVIDNEEGLKVDVEVWGTDFEQACLGPCGNNQLEVIAFVQNQNTYTIENLRMTYTIPEYGIKYRSAAYEVTPGDQTTIELLVELPFDIEPGIYYPTISLSDGEIRRVKPGYLEILG